MAKYKLKEQPQQESHAYLAARHQPSGGVGLGRSLLGGICRVLQLCLLLLLPVAIFGVLPLGNLGGDSGWQQAADALRGVQSQPDNFEALRGLNASLEQLDLRQPLAMAYPDAWYQFFPRKRYEAAFGLRQVLALGLLKHGHEKAGLERHDQLMVQTGDFVPPDFPRCSFGCPDCKNGIVVKGCERCSGSGKLHLNESLKGTMRARATVGANDKVPQQCNICGGSGQLRLPCPKCQGRALSIKPAALQADLRHALAATSAVLSLEEQYRGNLARVKGWWQSLRRLVPLYGFYLVILLLPLILLLRRSLGNTGGARIARVVLPGMEHIDKDRFTDPLSLNKPQE